MPITKSAKKALRQARRRRERNLIKLDKIRSLRRQILRMTKSGKAKEAQEQLPLFYKAVDKAAKTNVIKDNTAARRKSRLTKVVAVTLAK